MKCTLIDYTGAGFSDPWHAANLLIFTKNTRIKMSPDGLADIASWTKEKKHEELAYMANTIRSSWEFVDYVFVLQDVTRAFTHQLVRSRHASFAQQTMQILKIDATNVLTPHWLSDNNRALWNMGVAFASDTYEKMIEGGTTVEEARGILPHNVLTNIVVKMNLRTLTEVFHARISPRNLGEYSDVAKAMRGVVLNVHPWAAVFINSTRDIAMERLDHEIQNIEDPDKRNLMLKLVDQIRRD